MRPVVLVLLLALAACSAVPAPEPVPAAPVSSPVPAAPVSTAVPAAPVSTAVPAAPVSTAADAVDCAHVIGGEDVPSEGAQVILDAVLLPSRVLEPQNSGEPGWLFAKQGLVVRAGTAVELTVAPSAAGKATIGWGSPGPQGTTISVPACPGSRKWLAFAGGYTVREPLCVPLIVRVDGREERAEVSVGAECA